MSSVQAVAFRAIAVTVYERIGFVVKRDRVKVNDVRVVDGVAPGDVAVISEGRIPRTEEASTEQVPALAADHVALVPLPRSEKRLMWIYEHQCVARRRFVGTNRPHVRTDVLRQL